jgi:hypothetical protein
MFIRLLKEKVGFVFYYTLYNTACLEKIKSIWQNKEQNYLWWKYSLKHLWTKTLGVSANVSVNISCIGSVFVAEIQVLIFASEILKSQEKHFLKCTRMWNTQFLRTSPLNVAISFYTNMVFCSVYSWEWTRRRRISFWFWFQSDYFNFAITAYHLLHFNEKI